MRLEASHGALAAAAAAAAVIAASWLGLGAGSSTAMADPWEQAHGMNFVETSAGRYLIWSDQYGVGSTNGNWNHDVFALKLRESEPAESLPGKFVLVSAHEAQEPASASVAGDGSVIVTFEDGNAPTRRGHDYSVTQRYALFDARLHTTKPYDPARTTICWGGHSGHAASTRDRHVVAYSEGWVDGGGVKGRGTGDDVWVASLKTNGSKLRRVRVAVGCTHRDGWPVVAASPSKALVIWERYTGKATTAKLGYAVFDPRSGELSKRRYLKGRVRLYNQQAVYLSKLKRFVVMDTGADGKGRVWLLTSSGKVVDKCLAPAGFAREAKPAVITRRLSALLACPCSSGGVQWLKAGNNCIRFVRAQGKTKWSSRGTVGFVSKSQEHIYFATLGTTSLKFAGCEMPKAF